MVGGKQIEVMGVVSDEDYSRGRCFQDAAVAVPLETAARAPMSRPVAKAFTIPTLKGGSARSPQTEGAVPKPRHDPDAQGPHTHTHTTVYWM